MFIRNSSPRSKNSQLIGSYEFGSTTLLICGLATLLIAVLGWAGVLWPSFRSFKPYAFTFVLFVGPMVLGVATMDIRRSGLTWNRSLAFVCASIAFTLAVARIYQVIYRT